MTSKIEQRAVAELEAGGRILVSRLQHLGDVVLTLPAVYALRARFPKAGIDYLSRAAGAEVLDGEPVFGRVFRVPEKEEGAWAAWSMVRELRRRGYAAAVDFYSNPRSALLVRSTGARLRVGGARRVRRHLYTHSMSVPVEIRSAIEHHLYYLRPLGVNATASKPVLNISAEERESALARLEAAGVRTAHASRDSAKIIGLHPGAKWMVKRWPLDYFADLARRMIEVRGCQVVIMAGPDDTARQAALQARVPRAVSLPLMRVREAAAVIAELDGMVASDGGIMHVSVAVGTPTVGIFGSSEPDIWFPYEAWGPFAPAFTPIECRPCHLHTCDHLSCLRWLTSENVERTLLDVLERPLARDRGPGR